ncbi:LysR substrate-binding domain-containing protein [Bradyrhizobium sp. USDA 4469]
MFDRNQHGVTLTALGTELLGDARRLLSAVDESADRLRRQALGQAGRLRLGFGGSTLYSLLPRLLRRFADAHPNVSIDFHPMPVLAQIEALRDDIIDLGLLRLPVHDELLATRAIHSEPLIVAVPVDSALAQLPHPTLADMAGCCFVAYQRSRGFGYYNDLIGLCASAGFAPNIVHEAATTEAIVGIVACGQGVAIVPEAAQRLMMDGVAFRYPRFPDSAPSSLTTVEFALAWRRDSPSPVARQFVAMVD